MGNHILYRGIENGKRVKRKIPYKPTLYVKSKKPGTKFFTLHGEPLEPIQLEGIYEAKDFCKRYEHTENFKIYGNQGYGYSYISEEYPETIEFDKEQVDVTFIDIEVSSSGGFPNVDVAAAPVTAITLFQRGTYHVWGCREFDCPKDRNISYYLCDDEKDLLEKFFEHWAKNTPDIVTGWNIEMFDIPYLINRCHTLYMAELSLKFSPWGKVSDREVTLGTKKKMKYYSISGVAIVEYIDVYKKYSKNPNQESYALENISQVELGEGKYKFDGSLEDLYQNHYQKFIEYNIRDVELVVKIDDKLGLLELVMALAYDNKVNYEDVFMQVRMWDSITNDFLRRRNIIIPPKEDKIKPRMNEGAFVKSPIIGLHGWGASFDLDGLYPHLIMMYNISPETLVEDYDLPHEVAEWKDQVLGTKSVQVCVNEFANQSLDFSILKKYNLSVTPNGVFYRKDKHGFLPQIMETKYARRKHFKDLMLEHKSLMEKATDPAEVKRLSKLVARYDNWQSALKITLNSAYGAIANEWFRMYDMRNAEAITLSGQIAVKFIERKLNTYFNKMLKTDGRDYIVAIDTDSVYIDLDLIVQRGFGGKTDPQKIVIELDKFCKQHIQPAISKWYAELTDYVNAYAAKLNMKRESIYGAAIWTAKKRYMLHVYNNEGVAYNKPKLKITGLEAIKSSVPKIAREAQKAAYDLILTTKDVIAVRQFVDKFRIQFKTLPVKDIASPRSCNGLDTYHDPKTIWGFKTPIHVRGALVFNHMIKQNKLDKKVELIKEGEKVRYIYLKEPNTVQSDVISFVDKLPSELGLGQYLDYETQFSKVFLDPLDIVLKSIGWKLEEESSLEALFG